MLNKAKEDSLSKFLSYVLRHAPEEISIELDKNGWVSTAELIEKSKEKNDFSINDLKQVVQNNAKQRFAFSEDFSMIRANQGHSVNVDLNLAFVEPPEILYHGTATRFLESIQKEGLKAMDRHDVHLSFNEKTASSVGERHGKVFVLNVLAKKMYQDGYKFQCTKNNVWLTKEVPAKYLLNI